MKRLTVFVFLLTIQIVFAQSISNSIYTSTRLSDLTYSGFNILNNSFGRYLSVPALSAASDRSSSGTIFKINDQTYSTFAFNFRSPDLLPLDLLNIDSVAAESNGELSFFRREISNELKVRTHFFLGSETGDPLIHIYTRKDTNLFNKNKIIPSGSVTAENTLGNFKYRFTGAYYGFFSTGAENDFEIQETSEYYSAKQNKQFLVSFESEYYLAKEQKLQFETGLISYYGWDIPPFIDRIVHFEMYNYFADLRYTDPGKNLIFHLRNENSTALLNKQAVTPETGIDKRNYTAEAVISLYTSNCFNLKITPGINFMFVQNRKSYDNLMTEKIKKWMPSFSLSGDYELNKKTGMKTNVLAVKSIKDKYEISGSVTIDYWLSRQDNSLITLNSTIKQPEPEELFGNFSVEENKTSFFRNGYSIYGNPDLKSERINTISFNQFHKTDLLKVKIGLTWFNISNKIIREETANSEAGNEFSFFNKNKENYFQADFLINYKINKAASFQINYVNSSNRTSGFWPGHLLGINAYYSILRGTNLFGGFNFYSDRKNNSYNNQANMGDKGIFNVSISQTLYNFYLPEEFVISAKIENLFNNKVKYSRFGNSMGCTFVFNLNMVF